MSFKSNMLAMSRQPASDSDGLHDAVVSWVQTDVGPIALSKFSDDVWIGAPIGAMAAAPVSSRQIDLRKYPLAWRAHVRSALYAALRHPLRTTTTPLFATIIKRDQGFFQLFQFCERQGITPDSLKKEHVRHHVYERIQSCAHLETIVALLASLRGAAVHFDQKLIPFGFEYPFPLYKGTKGIAKALWREVHGKDFEGGGEVPFDDDDLTLVMSNAHLYVDVLSSDIATALERCLEISDDFPDRRSDRSQEGLCMRAQKKFLASLQWQKADSEIYRWPPKTARDLLLHARLSSAACAITISFATGARRSEIHSIKDDCLSHDLDGRNLLSLTQFKGRDEIHGVSVTIPVDEKVVAAITSQRRMKLLVRRYLQYDSAENVGQDFTDHLFVQSRSTLSEDQLPDDQTIHEIDDGRLSLNGLNAVVRSFKSCVTPMIDGPISFTRFRKSVARLVTLSMEGAPLILQVLYGHTKYRTTVGYMFASPMITDEVIASYPEFMANNLRTLYQEGDQLFGGGAASIRRVRNHSSMSETLTEGEIGMSENEFVQLGLEMMQNGQMILSLLGPGMYCLKPLLSRGPCNIDPGVLLPNIGRCTPSCCHHLLLGSQRPKIVRQVIWLQNRLNGSTTSAPMHEFYSRHLRELSSILEVT